MMQKDPIPENRTELKEKLNRDAGKIRWSALEEQQANELVIVVSDGLDLIEVACGFAEDNLSQIKQLLDAKSVAKVANEQAQQWLEADLEFWAVVVAPWVLVQVKK